MTTTIIWYLQVTLDRNAAMPGETIHVSFTLSNPLEFYLFIDSLAWNASFYSVDQMVVSDTKKIIAPGGTEYLGAGLITVPEVPEGLPQVDAVLRTLYFLQPENQWIDLGDVPLIVPRRFLVVHSPRFRAFVSRSLRTEDRPVVEAMLPVIQSWGFDTHTVGINELEEDPRRVSGRVLAEILKADCLIGIATPRDVSGITGLVRTFDWLNSESSFAVATRKPLIILADRGIRLEGVLESPWLPVLRFDPTTLPNFLATLNGVMPYVREAVQKDAQARLVEQARRAEAVVAYGAYVAGRIQGALPRGDP